MNNDNVVKIGTALKWRNTFDLTKKYYQENVVTACGCVFRCKVLQAQGKSPIKMTDDQGHIVYTNTDVWDVLVDMAYYYNHAVDTKKLTQQMLDYAKKLDEAFQKQQKEIEALQKDNKNQWNHISAIEKVNDEQQRELNAIFDTISCFSEGIWIDTLLWSNETIWDNNKYAITDDLQNQINELTETHCQDIEDLTEKHNSEISKLAAHVVQREKYQDGINNYLQDQVYDLNDTLCCFGTGVWENDLHWGPKALWDNNKYAITDALSDELKRLTETHREDVNSINANLKASDKAFADAVLKNTQEHRLVNERLQKHEEEIASIQTLIREHDQQIMDLLETLTCYSYGQWDNGLKWGELTLWENSNQMCDTFDDIYRKIANHQRAIEELAQRISEIKLESPTAQIESLRQEMITANRKTAYQIRAIGREQQVQDTDIAKIGEHFSCFADGIWGDLFIWDNDLLWANETGVINEAISDLQNVLSDTQQKLNETNEDIMTNLSLIRANHQLIEINSADIQDNKKTIENTQSEFHTVTDEIRKEALAEHRQVAYQLRAIGRDQEAQNENIAKLGEHFNCFADGVWGDLFLWDNDRLWANSTGVIIRALEEIHEELDFHQKTLDAIIEEKNEHFSCFHDDVWCNSSLWRNDHLWPFSVADLVSTFQKQDEEIQAIQKSAKEIHSQTAVKIVNIENSISEIKSDNAKIQAKTESNTSLIQENQERIDANSEKIADNEKNIQNLNNEIKHQSEELNNKLLSEHRQVAYQLRALNREQAAQDENIAQIGCHFSCYADGLWGNHFLWNNINLWANEPGVVESAFDDVNSKLNAHKETFDSILNEQTEHFDCFGDDVWCNSSVWKNDRIWPGGSINYDLTIQKLEDSINETSESLQVLKTQSTTEFSKINDTLQTSNQKLSEITTSLQKQATQVMQNSESIQIIAKDIQQLDSDISETTKSLREEAQTEHRQIAYQLRTIDQEQTVQDDKITKLAEHFGCFVDGKWGDLFLWNNDHLWNNHTRVVEEAISDTNERIDAIESEIETINLKAEEHQSEYQAMLDDIRSYNGCFEKGEWANPFFWNDTDVWYNSPNAVSEAETEIIKHDTRLTALESQFKLFLQQFAAQQTIIEQQQDILETFTDCFTVLNLGRWHNLLFWDNSSKWSNVMITEAATDGGIASVAVKSYDPETKTVSI